MSKYQNIYKSYTAFFGSSVKCVDILEEGINIGLSARISASSTHLTEEPFFVRFLLDLYNYLIIFYLYIEIQMALFFYLSLELLFQWYIAIFANIIKFAIMKIKRIITFALTIVAFVVNASPITLRYIYSTSNKIKDPIIVQPIKKRTPIQPINAEQAEHIIKFSQYLMGMNVELVYNEFVVFATRIDSNGCVELPEDLKGKYELRLYSGENVYLANIEL